MRRLAFVAILVSSSALAQTTPPGVVGPDNGFFRPTPGGDPSLTHPPAPPYTTLSTAPAPAPVLPTPALVPVEVPVDPVAAAAALAAERELNRAEREALEAQARARATPAPIPGAFTGLTNERDR